MHVSASAKLCAKILSDDISLKNTQVHFINIAVNNWLRASIYFAPLRLRHIRARLIYNYLPRGVRGQKQFYRGYKLIKGSTVSNFKFSVTSSTS